MHGDSYYTEAKCSKARKIPFKISAAKKRNISFKTSVVKGRIITFKIGAGILRQVQ
jgi:hypothetical protein